MRKSKRKLVKRSKEITKRLKEWFDMECIRNPQFLQYPRYKQNYILHQVLKELIEEERHNAIR